MPFRLGVLGLWPWTGRFLESGCPGFPLVSIAHDDLLALRVVVDNARFQDIFFTLDAELLLDFNLDGAPVAVPSKT